MMSGRLSTLPPSPGADQLGNDFRSLFTAFDKDNNGYIDGEELRQTMSAVGLQLSDRDVAMMMNAAGVPSGGRIYYEGESAVNHINCLPSASVPLRQILGYVDNSNSTKFDFFKV